MRPIQKFSKEYLEHCRAMTPDQIARFLDDFRNLHGDVKPKQSSKLISIKIPPALLDSFRTRCQMTGIPYQSQIKKLMKEWVSGERE